MESVSESARDTDDDVTQPVTWASKQYSASSYSVVEECCHYCFSEQAISEHELSGVRYKEPVVGKGKTVEDRIKCSRFQ